MLTTFSEKSSANENNRLKSPRELRKFSKLEVVDAVSGQDHLLVHGKQHSDNLTTSSSSPDLEQNVDKNKCALNDLNRTYTKPVDEDSMSIWSLKTKLQQCFTAKDSNVTSKIPISETRKRTSAECLVSSRKSSQSSVSNELSNNGLPGKFNLETGSDLHDLSYSNLSTILPIPIEKSFSLNEFEKLEQEQNEAIAGEESNELIDLNDMIIDPDSGESGKPINTDHVTIQNDTISQKSFGSGKSLAITEFHLTPIEPAKEEMQELITISPTDEQKINEIELQTRPSSNNHQSMDSPNEEENFKEKITFIDNGIDVTDAITATAPSSIETISKSFEDDAVNFSMVNGVEETIEVMNAVQLEDTLLGENLNGIKDIEQERDLKEGNY